jgi:hypothetical protein
MVSVLNLQSYNGVVSQPVSRPMRHSADIVVSKEDRPVLMVEIKAGKETSPTAAARFRRNLIENKMVADAPFLLLAFKTSLFLWRKETSLDEPADFTAPIKPILEFYLQSHHDNPYIGEESIQIAVHSWLRDLAIGIRQPDPASPPDQMLLDSGLYNEMYSGDVRPEVRL